MKLEFSSGGIIYKVVDDKPFIALIKDSYGRWTLPKGHIEKGEKPEFAAVREVSEEIGITELKVKKQLDKIDFWFKMNDETYHKYVYYYLMEAPAGSELKPQEEEIQGAQWFTPEEALEKIDYKKDSLALLQKAIEEINRFK